MIKKDKNKQTNKRQENTEAYAGLSKRIAI